MNKISKFTITHFFSFCFSSKSNYSESFPGNGRAINTYPQTLSNRQYISPQYLMPLPNSSKNKVIVYPSSQMSSSSYDTGSDITGDQGGY